MSVDLRPAAQWPDSGARALEVRRYFPMLDPVSGVWGYGKRADGALEAEDGVYGINAGSTVHTVRLTKTAAEDALLTKII